MTNVNDVFTELVQELKDAEEALGMPASTIAIKGAQILLAATIAAEANNFLVVKSLGNGNFKCAYVDPGKDLIDAFGE